MAPSPRQDFCFSIALDNGLLRQSVAAGEQIPPAEILSLAAAAQAIYLTATLESRQSDRIDECHRLWSETTQLFNELCDAWARTDSNDPQIHWLRGRLTHFQSLSLDRVALYDVSERQRLAHVARRDIGLETAFSERPGLADPF